MHMRMFGLALIFLLLLPIRPVHAAPEPSYGSQLSKTFSRGFKNVISSPWEIPYTIGQYDHGTTNCRAFRDAAGFFDGTFRMLTRFGGGMWDMVWAFIPGDQEGLPLKPETFS